MKLKKKKKKKFVSGAQITFEPCVTCWYIIWRVENTIWATQLIGNFDYLLTCDEYLLNMNSFAESNSRVPLLNQIGYILSRLLNLTL